MTAAIVIVGEIGSKSCPKRCLIDSRNVVETISADRSNQALNIWALPGRSGCDKHLTDPHVLQLPLNDLAVNAISIPNNISRSRVIGKSVKKLLGDPFRGWMRRNVEVNYAAPLMR